MVHFYTWANNVFYLWSNFFIWTPTPALQIQANTPSNRLRWLDVLNFYYKLINAEYYGLINKIFKTDLKDSSLK